MSSRRVGGSILLVLMLVAAGCGDDDADSAAGATTPSTATTVDAGSGDAGDPGGDGGVPGDLPTVLSSNECFAAATALGSAFSGGITPGGAFDPDGIGDAFDRLGQVAPSEIQGDLALMADGLGLFFSVLENENIDLSDPATLAAPGVAEALEDAVEIFESADFQAASDNVNAWFENMCAEVGG